MFVDDRDFIVHRIEEGHARIPQHSLVFVYLVKSDKKKFLTFINVFFSLFMGVLCSLPCHVIVKHRN